MHHEEWSGSRVAAALARLAEAGYPQARLARMAGVDRSAVNRWSRGENRPGHDAVRRLAAAVFRDEPGIARELVEASGYAWAEPAEPPAVALVPPELERYPSLVEDIRKRYPDPDDYLPMLEAIAATLRGDPPPTAPAEEGPSPGRRAG